MCRIIVCLCLAAFALAASAAEVTIYVSPRGDDAALGTKETPLATLQGARDAVRKLAEKGPLTGPVTIVIGSGPYFLSEPLVLEPQDSGSEAAPVTYQAQGEAVISGGRPIAGWEETQQQGLRKWTVTLPEVKSGEWNFRQLFVQRQDEGEWTRRFRPHRGMFVVAGTTWSPARKTAAHRAAQQDFVFYKGDLQQFENLDDVEVVALHSWSASRLKIKSLDLEKDIVTFTSVPTFRIGHWYRDEHNPYYVENVKEDLRQPGQWYLDRPTGLLTYLPLPGETLANTRIVAPRLEKLVIIKGDPEKKQFVSNVRFEGLTFAHTEWPVPEQGYDVSQGQPSLPAALEFTGARNCGFDGCVIAHTGAYGLSLGIGTIGCFARGCHLYDLGGGGIKVGDSAMKQTAGYPLLPTDNAVENNLISNTGLMHYSANGIWCGIVKGTKIRHNEVRHNPYTGIACGWNWSPSPTSAADNVIEANHVHHVMELVQDGGGIYTLGRQPGNIIRGNLVHDNHKSPYACDNGQVGIYFDEGSTGFTVDENIVYDVDWNNCQIAHNQNAATDHTFGNNYLGVKPGAADFPDELAAKAGLEPEYRQLDQKVAITPNPCYAMTMPVIPPAPVGLALDFEDVPVGETPRKLRCAGFAGPAKFGVTDETAVSGKQCLKLQDLPDLPKSFYPYVTYSGYEVKQGEVTISFLIKQSTEKPGEFCVDLRDYLGREPGTFASGPSFLFSGAGKLVAGGQEVAALPLGEWSQVQVRFSLGEGQKKEYELTVTLPDKAVKTLTLPFAKADFTVMTDFYLIGNDTKDAVTYLDDVVMTVK